jgi:hypothetical protein
MMVDEDRALERAAAALRAEQPAAAGLDVVEARAGAIRRRRRLGALGALACIVAVSAIVISALRPAGVVTVTTAANDPTSHTTRYRFTGSGDEPSRTLTAERLRERYLSAGTTVTVTDASADGFSLTDQLPDADSASYATALSTVGATSLRPVIARVATTGDVPTCAPGSVPQLQPQTSAVVTCYVLGAAPVVDAVAGPLASHASLPTTGSTGTLNLALRDQSLASELDPLLDACARRTAACPTGLVALQLDETVAATSAVPDDATAPGRLTVHGLFDHELGTWLASTLESGALPVPIERIAADALTPATTGR